MNLFEKTVLMIALLVLIIGLLLVGSSFKKTSDQANLTTSACPDFWFSSYFEPCILSTHGCCDDGITAANADKSNCMPCKDTDHGCCADGITAKKTADDACLKGTPKCWNVNELGTKTDNCSKIDDPDNKFKLPAGNSVLCNQQKWAKDCHLAWDGVTNVASGC
jgi:hypothetical protein